MNSNMKRDPEEVFLMALLTGDPGAGIEFQEKAGQGDLIREEVLPRKFNYGTQEQLERAGVVFGEPVDDLFCKAVLPSGWRKKPTDHSMWSQLLDEKGRERASIFYKAAFYDRGAFVNVNARFHYKKQPLGGYGDNYDPDTPYVEGVVTDQGEIIWKTEPVNNPAPESGSTRDAWHEYDRINTEVREQAHQWLLEHYPDFEDPCAYWNE